MPDPMHPSMEEEYGLPTPGTHCQVLFCGREDNLPGNRVEITRQECLFHLVTSGRGYVSYASQGRRTWSLGPGHGFFALPGQRCLYRPDPLEPWSYRWIGFSATDLAELLSGIGVDAEHPVIHLPSLGDAESLLTRILSLLRDRPLQADLKAAGALYQLLAELAAGADGHPTALAPRSFTDVARDFIQTQYHRGITVEDVARHVGVSSSYLLKLFRRETGGSIRDYLVDTRLERARTMLKFSSVSVAEAGFAVGYRTYTSFEKTFRQKTGCSPTDWRQGLFYGPPRLD